MRKAVGDVAAILCADIHLWNKPPLARSNEPDWWEAMRRQLVELRELATKYDAPVICAGDLFDRWNPGPELVNFALIELPHLYAVPGQHDLCNHNYADIRKTAFWTLVKAGKITLLEPGRPVVVSKRFPLQLWGYPFGCSLKSCPSPHDLMIDIAVVHSYLWTKDVGGYDGASQETRLKHVAKKLKGYDVACWGDNHSPFSTKLKTGCQVHNCGGLFRRKMDERSHKPSIGLLKGDGTIERHYLDVSKDVFLDEKDVPKSFDSGAMQPVLDAYASLGDAAINFREEIHRELQDKKPNEVTTRYILNSLELKP